MGVRPNEFEYLPTHIIYIRVFTNFRPLRVTIMTSPTIFLYLLKISQGNNMYTETEFT